MQKKHKSWKEHGFFTILFGNHIVPEYVPLYYRIYTLYSKMSKSIKRRLCFCLSHPEMTSGENIAGADNVLNLGHRTTPLINKTFSRIDDDLARKDIKRITEDLQSLKEMLNKKHLRFTTAAGNFKRKDLIGFIERRKLWENAWMFKHSGIKTQDVVLDIGGASSIFSFFLAHRGCHTFVVDNDLENHAIIYNARYVSKKMHWKMNVYNRDASKRLPFADNFFDKVFCICVLEHLLPLARRQLMKELGRVLNPGGVAGLTFDYNIDRETTCGRDKGLRYRDRQELMQDVIEPSGLTVYGNNVLLDDCPSSSFLGGLFLTKAF